VPTEVTSTVPTARFEVAQESAAEFLPSAISLLNATRRGDFEKRRLNWLYLDNPDGEALVWVVRSSESGDVAGFAAALPRRMSVEGREKAGLNCADLSVHPNFRRQGVATLLRSATRKAVDEGRFAFLYAHPNDRAAGAHVKAGHVCVGQMQRWARPVRLGRFVAEKLGGGSGSRFVGSAIDSTVNVLGRPVRQQRSTSNDVAMSIRFDERFDRLWSSSRVAAPVLGVRDATYLNWRYAESPLYDVHAILAEDMGELTGYLLFRIAGCVAHILDVFPPTDSAVTQRLLDKAIREFWRLGLASASVTMLNAGEFPELVRARGFRRRSESSGMYAHANADLASRDVVESQESWFVMVGDRDA